MMKKKLHLLFSQAHSSMDENTHWKKNLIVVTGKHKKKTISSLDKRSNKKQKRCKNCGLKSKKVGILEKIKKGVER